LRQRAEEAHAHTKAIMLGIAQDYEKLAEREFVPIEAQS
jgi:hypothetical protein